MDSLIVCSCAHTIATHESGRCRAPGCSCLRGTLAVLNAAIDLTKGERGTTTARSTLGTVA